MRSLKRSTWDGVVQEVKERHPTLSTQSYKFKHLVAERAEEAQLTGSEAVELAMHLGIKWYPRPKNVPSTWPVTLCKSYLAARYSNTNDPVEYVVVTQPAAYGKRPYVIHRTAEGYADMRWFSEMVPQLQEWVEGGLFGFKFGPKFNKAVNQRLSAQPGGMALGQLQVINQFFEAYVPGIEGICTTCYKVSLPLSGAGERWTWKSDTKYEIRLSAAKPEGLPGQRKKYVTQTSVDERGGRKHLKYQASPFSIEYTRQLQQEATHIPWEDYDFEKFSLDMPTCRCKKGC